MTISTNQPPVFGVDSSVLNGHTHKEYKLTTINQTGTTYCTYQLQVVEVEAWVAWDHEDEEVPRGAFLEEEGGNERMSRYKL